MLDTPVTELVSRMRAGALSPVDLVDAHIARAEAVNPHLNALIATRYEAARADAREACARYAKGGETPPLLGVPCTIKEFLRVDGMPHTGGGIPNLRHQLADRDATVVQRIRAAGAIILGVTNAAEGGMWMETNNRVFGRTRNPWGTGHTPGGSSGGEGAAVAAGASAFGVGSDVGGSIRIPAAFCGVFGHKPSAGVVPNSGHWPDDFSVGGYLCTGPLGRTVADLWALLRVLAGPDGIDPAAREIPLEDPTSIDLRDVTVYPVEDNARVRVRPVMRHAVRRATAALVDAGARVGHLPGERLRRGFEMWSAALTRAGAPDYADLLGGHGPPIPIGRELLHLLAGRPRHDAPAVLLAALEKATHLLEGTARRALAELDALRIELTALLGPRGIIIHPPYTRPAPRHMMPMLTPFDPTCTALFNVLEFPSTVVPMGFDATPLPIAVQVIGRHGADGVTLAAASVLERAFGGWVRADPR